MPDEVRCRPTEGTGAHARNCDGLAGFVRDGDTVLIDAATGGGVTLTTEASPEEAAATNGHVMAEGGEA